MVAICVSTNSTRTTSDPLLDICVCVCFCGHVERAVMSVAQRFTLSLLMSFWLPPVVSLLSLATYIRELTNAPMSPPLSLPHTLCLSPNRNSSPPSLIFSFSPSVQLPSRLYQWRFWFHYCWGQSFLCSQGEWHTILTHCASGVDTEMHRNKDQGASDEHNKVWTELRW